MSLSRRSNPFKRECLIFPHVVTKSPHSNAIAKSPSLQENQIFKSRVPSQSPFEKSKFEDVFTIKGGKPDKKFAVKSTTRIPFSDYGFQNLPVSSFDNRFRLRQIDHENWKREKMSEQKYRLAHYGVEGLRYKSYSSDHIQLGMHGNKQQCGRQQPISGEQNEIEIQSPYMLYYLKNNKIEQTSSIRHKNQQNSRFSSKSSNQKNWQGFHQSNVQEMNLDQESRVTVKNYSRTQGSGSQCWNSQSAAKIQSSAFARQESKKRTASFMNIKENTDEEQEEQEIIEEAQIISNPSPHKGLFYDTKISSQLNDSNSDILCENPAWSRGKKLKINKMMSYQSSLDADQDLLQANFDKFDYIEQNADLQIKTNTMKMGPTDTNNSFSIPKSIWYDGDQFYQLAIN